ncbi:ribonuclease HII [Candidatus Saccharibacteria bacterium]|nr:ribonuclease HII [Candidatus Saccharibacteria bacterium]
MAILGIDEVGRGPLAGPLVVGAVILPEEKSEWVEDLRDSKKMSAKKREKLSAVILTEAPATGLGWVSPFEIDEVGISEALRLATTRAVKSVQRLHVPFSQIVIDGKVNFLKDTMLSDFVSVMPKADDLVKEVSAASIIAKVARDKYMCEISEKYPEYSFSSHVGYGTAKHIAAIREFGICPEHRRSFEPIKSMVGFERADASDSISVVKNTTLIGKKGEDVVGRYLVSIGHEIVAQNFKTYFYEIDIVSRCGDKIYFTEVKTRKNHVAGGGVAAIDAKKLEKMKFAAECFLKYHREFSRLNPLLAVASVNGKFEVEDWFEII